jgi:DNA-binding CsgD family transcriptional regulator
MATSISKDLFSLTHEDFQDIFNIIHITNRCLKAMEMRAKVVTSLKHAFQAKGVAFFLGDGNLGAIDNTNLVSIGLDRRYLKQYARYYCHHDPFRQDIHSRKPVCKVDDIIPYSRWINLKIYNEFYQLQNIHYKLSIYLRSRVGILGLIGIFRARDHEDFSEREMAKARVLAPCLASALENINRTLKLNKTENFSIECANEPAIFGFIILNSDLRPVYWNSEAMEFCFKIYDRQESRDNDSEGKMFPISREIMQDCVALKNISKNGVDEPASLRLQRVIKAKDNKKYQVVTSLIRESYHQVTSLNFFIYVRELSENYWFTRETLDGKHQLTEREADIALYVCQGLTNNEIGERLSISRFTVETHLKNIFNKTMIKHRAGLASLLRSR